MTNREQLNQLSTQDFVSKMHDIFCYPFIEYTDIVAYFDSEDPDMKHFIKHEGVCTVMPSDVEKRMNPNASGHENCLFLGKTSMYGEAYCVIADLQHYCIIKVPASNVIKE